MNQVGIERATALSNELNAPEASMKKYDLHRSTCDKDELIRVDFGRGVTKTVSHQAPQNGSETVGRVPDTTH
jgi:hypothetical protein